MTQKFFITIGCVVISLCILFAAYSQPQESGGVEGGIPSDSIHTQNGTPGITDSD